MRYGIGFGATLLAVLLAGCNSPADRIKQSCIADGKQQTKFSEEKIETLCGCFANGVAETVKGEQLDKLVALYELPNDKRLAASKELSEATQLAVIGALDKCRPD